MFLKTEHVFFKKYLPLVMGGVFLLLSIMLALSLVSYHATDPSFNRATGAEVQNLAGVTGAFLADPLLQFVGVASSIIVLALAVWGAKLLFRQRIGLFWLRFSLLFMCISSAATLVAFIPIKEWVITDFEGLGGFIGRFIKDEFSFLLGVPIVVGVSSVLFPVSFFIVLGLSLNEWKHIGIFIGRRCVFAKDVFVWCAVHFYRLMQMAKKIRRRGHHYEEASYDMVSEPEQGNGIVEMSSVAKKAKPKRKVMKQKTLKLSSEDFEVPDLNYLTKPQINKKKDELSESALSQNARLLEKVLSDFGIMGNIVKVRPGPVVTLYELEPAAGTKSSRVIGLADDIARSMSAISARIAVIPGKNAIGIELPNNSRETVYLRELFDSDEYKDPSYKLPIALGKDIGGESVIVDLTRMPHLLVAGTTGSGKSVAINSMIMSFLYRLTPEECKFIMIDPKMLELSVYDGIPHLLSPVVTEPAKAVVALKWAVREMESRYRLMSNLGVRNVAGYNKKIRTALKDGEVLERSVQTGFDPETGRPIIEKQPLDMTPLPFIVIIVDEMADLMLVAGKDIEASIQRLAQMARAAGIHLIMATQRPSVDVITGVIKANFPTRISFQVTSRIDSRTILGEQGAEQLLGMGDMLYMAGGGRITRAHGPFLDDKEVEEIVSYLKTQGTPSYVDEVTEEVEDPASGAMQMGTGDKEADLYQQAVMIVCRDKKASTSYIQRSLKIGYNRAANIIEEMERQGVVSAANHVGRREVLITHPEEAHA